MDFSWFMLFLLILAVWYVFKRPKSVKSKQSDGLMLDGRSSERAESGFDAYRFPEDAIPVSLTLTMSYKSVDGSETHRTVDVKRVYPAKKIYFFDAFCKLRNSNRTFRTDRVLRCVDALTGEIIQDLNQYLEDAINNSPFSRSKKLIKNHRDVLMVLLFLAKADGQLRAAERSVITSACNEIAPEEQWTEEDVKAALSSMDTPSRQAFNLAVGRLAKSAEAPLETVMDASRRIVATQKSVHAAEQEALDYILRRLTERA
jgi:hypothetical protein